MKVSLVLLFVAVLSHVCIGQPTPTPTPTPDPAVLTKLKEQNAQALKLNELITTFDQQLTARQWAQAETTADQLIAIEPRPEYYRALGMVQLNLGKYDAAVASLETSVQKLGTWEQLKAADDTVRRGAGQALVSEGNAFIKLKRNDDAIKAYNRAAELDSNPGIAYFNICALEYNLGNANEALAACNKSLAADPKRADAWFIKGSLLLANSTMDNNGSMQPPPGTVEALKNYLELAPQGPHVLDVKQMLDVLKIKY